jgi:hypothetical protein
VLLAIAVLLDCVGQPTVEELVAQRIVVTKFDPEASFASFRTFAIADTVVVLASLDAGQANPQVLDPAVSRPMLQEIAAQLSSRGYVQVARTEGPDLGVPVTALNQVRVQVPYGTWWSYGPAGPTYWGYPNAPIAAGLSYDSIAWQSGTLVIELDDLRAARDQSTNASVRVVWAGIIHGVIGAAGTSLEAPPIESIRQAFAQSPYLRR